MSPSKENYGEIHRGMLFVTPKVYTLLQNNNVRETIMNQLPVIDHQKTPHSLRGSLLLFRKKLGDMLSPVVS